MWLNTPGNPTGKVLGVEHLAKVVGWAREHGVVVASDECYAELDWRPRPEGSSEPPTTPSILDPRVTGGSHEGLLCVYSLSKQSNLAGYRAAFVAGDPVLVGRLLEVRKHAGMIVPWPVQQALAAALRDPAHVVEQKVRYARRRDVLRPAVEAFGLRVDDSEAGLYLWATAGEDGRTTLARLADRGVLAAPGDFYGARRSRARADRPHGHRRARRGRRTAPALTPRGARGVPAPSRLVRRGSRSPRFSQRITRG